MTWLLACTPAATPFGGLVQMAFPTDFIPPLCDGFIDRLERLLRQKQHLQSLLSKIDYCVVTLQLLIERNHTAHQYLVTRLLTDKNLFVRHVLYFLFRYEEEGMYVNVRGYRSL